MDVLTLDGSYGEGGGQILRTALSLSAVTGRAFRLTGVRAGRRNPGLLAQHLSALRATATIVGAIVSGDRLGSTELSFCPTVPAQIRLIHFRCGRNRGTGQCGRREPNPPDTRGPARIGGSGFHSRAARRDPRGMVTVLRRPRDHLYPRLASNRLLHRR